MLLFIKRKLAKISNNMQYNRFIGALRSILILLETVLREIRRIVPSSIQYKKWSLPSKLTFWGLVVGIIGVFLGIISLTGMQNNNPAPPDKITTAQWLDNIQVDPSISKQSCHCAVNVTHEFNDTMFSIRNDCDYAISASVVLEWQASLKERTCGIVGQEPLGPCEDFGIGPNDQIAVYPSFSENWSSAPEGQLFEFVERDLWYAYNEIQQNETVRYLVPEFIHDMIDKLSESGNFTGGGYRVFPRFPICER